jgi:hemerythrin-like domain-containing protein
MMPVGPLMIEHRLIARVAVTLDRMRAKIERDRTVDPAAIDAAVDFIRTYADRCHHGKEEDILFAACRGKALSPELSRTMQELVDQHVQGRALVARLAAASSRHRDGEPGALDEICELLGTISAFYLRHIELEDERFFVAIMDSFTKPERDELHRECLRFDQEFIHRRYRALADQLEEP